MEDSLYVNPHLRPAEQPAPIRGREPRVVICYRALIDPHAGPYVDYHVWAEYFGVYIDAVKTHAKEGRIPVDRDRYGRRMPNPAWSLAWRDMKWMGKGKGYVFGETEAGSGIGFRSGLPFGVVDPRVGERTTGLPL